MKAVFFGIGSIGQRHIKNLKQLIPGAEIIAVRTRKNDISVFEKDYPIKVVSSFKEALTYKPTCAFITNPTSLHVQTALVCATSGLDLFIEKPLGDSTDQVKSISNAITSKKLMCMVGYMMHYHPGLLYIKQVLDNKSIGTVMSVQIINGEYLPAWHPWEDYRDGYSARKELGGGIILTFSHETEYSAWLFGNINHVYGVTNKTKTLKTNVEDSADLLLTTDTNIPISIHLDHISSPPLRRMTIIGDEGRIEWDYHRNEVQLFSKNQKTPDIYSYTFDRNDMFKSEVQDFFVSIKTRKQPRLNLANGIKNLEVLLAAKKSAKLKKRITL